MGDIYYSPAGTIHAIGAGLVLVQVQQIVDLTIRLYDYRRPRELHLDAAVEAARAAPHVPSLNPYVVSEGRQILAAGSKFVLERWRKPAAGFLPLTDRPTWLIRWQRGPGWTVRRCCPGTVWLAENRVELELNSGTELLVSYPGGEVRHDLFS